MRALVDFALTRTPGLYAWLLARRQRLDVEKLVYLAVVEKGDVVFDAGANFGAYTLLFSHLVGRRGRVHAFEPVPETFKALQAGLTRGQRFDNVLLNDCALGEREGEIALFVPDADYGQASIARHRAGSWERPREVRRYDCRATTLDGYVQQRPEAAPAFVKCDVEGAELLVLRGGEETIRRHRPLIHLEVNPDWTRSLGYEPADVARFLASCGYSRFFLVDRGVQPLADPLRQLTTLAGSANLLCAVPGLHDRRLVRLGRAARGLGRKANGGGG